MDNFMDTLAERYNAQEMIRANSQADTMQMEGLQEQVEAYEAVLQEMRKLNYKNTELTEKMYSLVDESIERVRTLSLEAKEGGADTEQISLEMSEAVTGALNEAMAEVQGKVSELSGSVDSVKSSSEIIYNSLEDVLAETKALAAKVEEIRQQPRENEAVAPEVVVDNTEILNSVNESAQSVKESVGELSTSVMSVKEKTDTIDTYVRGLWESVEATKSALQKLSEKNAEQSGAENAKVDEDALNKAMASIEELRAGIMGIKEAQEESKNSLKSSFDSAIYGLKQDNREIVEFMQRMNSNIVAKEETNDKEQEEAAALLREQENKKFLEDRMKANEEFMHKESVKVYRNVQAVINEKTDLQSETLENKVKKNTQLLGQVKVVAILATILSGVDLIVLLLRIFGVL